MLPYIPYGDKITARQQTGFGGLNHNPSAADGELYQAKNLTSDLYPLLSSRVARQEVTTLNKANGLFAKEKLAWVDGTNFYYGNELIGQVADSHKTFASMGYFLLIFPDKKYFLTNWEEGNIYDRFGDLEASYTSTAGGISFSDGVYAGVQAEANTITTSGEAFPFREGDAVTISGCTAHEENNKTPVIQEISADGKTLRFYPNIFAIDSREYKEATIEEPLAATARAEFYVGSAYSFSTEGYFSVNQNTLVAISTAGAAAAVGKYYIKQEQESGSQEGSLVYQISSAEYITNDGDAWLALKLVKHFAAETYTENGAISIARTVPDMDYFCENENRLWGVKGKEIFACKLGDPFNWQVFSGLASDSYSVATGTDGNFTAAISYLGYPVLMKPEAIHKVYGTKPTNFQPVHSANMGVALGSEKSPAIVANTLYYLSENGVVAYQGGIPTVIDTPLFERLHDGIGGTDGSKYYLSAKDEENNRRLFVYDPRYNLWHEEDDLGITDMASLASQLYFLADNTIYQERGGSFDNVEWYAQTADFYEQYFGKKAAGPYLVLRYQLAQGAQMAISIAYDSGPWEEIGNITGDGKKQSIRLATIPARCDHYRLRFSGSGQMRLYSLTRESADGSAV